jgi:hypothetical protein
MGLDAPIPAVFKGSAGVGAGAVPVATLNR